MAVGQDHGIGRHQPDVEELVADKALPQLDPGGGRGEPAQLVEVIEVLRLLDPDRSHHLQTTPASASAGKGPDGSIEALVGLDEPDGEEDEVFLGQAQSPPGGRAVDDGAGREVRSVVGHGDALR